MLHVQFLGTQGENQSTGHAIRTNQWTNIALCDVTWTNWSTQTFQLAPTRCLRPLPCFNAESAGEGGGRGGRLGDFVWLPSFSVADTRIYLVFE